MKTILVITPFTIVSTALIAIGVWKVTEGNSDLTIAVSTIYFIIGYRIDTAVGKIEKALETLKR